MTHPLTIPLEAAAPIPVSWYTVGASRDLPAGGMIGACVAGINLVVYRTGDGSLCCIEDRCPHMGGRFSDGATIDADEIVCPVHHFRFAPDGTCRGSGYGTPAPRACTRPWPCLERNGLLLVFYHPEGQTPDWAPPPLDDADDWRPMRLFQRKVAAPIDIVMQGIADQGHLQTLHGYEDVQMETSFDTAGTQLAVTFSFTNVGSLPGLTGPLRGLGQRLATRTRVRFDYLACGMGYSVTDVELPDLGVATRHFVNPTPLDSESVTLHHSMALRRIDESARISPALAVLPRAWTEALMQRVLLKGFLHDIEDDIRLWTRMRNPEKPALARGDGPLHKYRRWSRQFYPSAV